MVVEIDFDDRAGISPGGIRQKVNKYSESPLMLIGVAAHAHPIKQQGVDVQDDVDVDDDTNDDLVKNYAKISTFCDFL